MGNAKEVAYAWTPQVGPQLDAIEATWVDELFFGGARGGGKSDFLLGDFLQDVDKYGKHWRGIIFRKTYDELEELQQRAEEMFPTTGATYRAVKRTWFWPNGAFLKMRYMELEKDYNRYHGHQYSWIGFDELTSWPSLNAYKKISSCLRQAQVKIPTKRIRCSGNPGGIGHNPVKARFVDPAPLGYEVFKDKDTGRSMMFIPSKLSDNKILTENDPDYINMLKGIGSKELVRCWLEGDWNVVLGAYFDNFGPQHIKRPFKIPRSWAKFRSFDWGSASPFSVGWWAVANGEQPDLSHYPPEERFTIPSNALVRYREWYGADYDKKGLKMRNEKIAKGIVARSKDESYAYSVADPSIFLEAGGPSIAETFLKNGVVFRKGDNRRIPGWQQLRSRLDGDDDGPMVYFFSTCAETLRTLPAQQHCDLDQEDINTKGEDHIVDEVRYACMSRPWSKPSAAVSDGQGSGGVTINKLMAQAKRLSRKNKRRW